MAVRRQLRLNSLDEIIADAENLHTRGYEKTGQWDLAQICNHCACWVRYPMDGFPQPPWYLKPLLVVLKHTLMKKIEKQMKQDRTFPKGVSTAPMTVFPAGQDESSAVLNLKNELLRMKTFAGPMHPSPLRGLLSKDEWVQTHLVHCAHHLSFLVPKS